MDTHLQLDRLTCEEIRGRLRRRPDRTPPDQKAAGIPTAPTREAAVLLPLYRQDDAWHLVYIRRAEQESDRHSGEVGFPGGHRQDSDADHIATALREAHEEIDLPPHRVQILGRLSPLRAISGFLVTPVVGWLPWPQRLRPDPREVSRIFSIPLAWLAHCEHHRIRPYPSPNHPEARNLVFFDEYDGEHLWGLTGRITLDFLERLTRPQGPST